MTHVHAEVTSDFHTRMKIVCARKRVSLKKYVIEALEERVKRDEKELR